MDAWFDLTRNVRTRGMVTLEDAGVGGDERRDSEAYQAAGVGYIRRALTDVPVRDFSRYSFVDVGSGKGQTLFVAAELGFARVVGVEFSRVLHQAACANVRRFRGRAVVESVCANARDFSFPAGPMVLFFFNPFGAETMREVMHRLQDSLWRNPRHVVVVLLCPQCADEVMRVEGMRRLKVRKDWVVFEVGDRRG